MMFKFRRTKRFLVGLLITPLALMAVAATPVLAASRDTFTWQKPASYITFNAITNNPAVGDERNFLDVRDLNQANYARTLKVTNGQELVFRVYYDNNAGSNLNLKAKNTKITIAFPANTAKNLSVSSYISANNSKPKVVSDSIALSGDSPISLSYETGSAQIWNNSLRGKPISDSIITSGALIGFGKLDGNVLGGAKYSGYITLKVRVMSSSSPAASGVPNTGPGSTVAIFIGVSIVGTAAHMLFSARRARQYL